MLKGSTLNPTTYCISLCIPSRTLFQNINDTNILYTSKSQWRSINHIRNQNILEPWNVLWGTLHNICNILQEFPNLIGFQVEPLHRTGFQGEMVFGLEEMEQFFRHVSDVLRCWKQFCLEPSLSGRHFIDILLCS